MFIPKVVCMALCLNSLLIGFVAQVGDLRDVFITHQVGDLLDELGLVHLIGEFGDDDGHLAHLERF
jgi:hypothetical protein